MVPAESNTITRVAASAVISALSYALDLTEGQPMGHALQTCVIGMRIAAGLGMARSAQADLYYGLLLKDAGCSSNASKLFHIIQSDEIQAKGHLKDKDWTTTNLDSLKYALGHVATGKPFLERVRTLLRVASTQQTDSCDLVKIRCERGASIARQIGFSMEVAMGIAGLDEHWDGRGYPMGVQGDEIPLLSRIMNLSQTLAVFWSLGGASAAEEVMQRRTGKWFDPALVQLAQSLAADGSLWSGLADEDILSLVAQMEPEDFRVTFDADRLDSLCLAFSEVIDTKSPFTYRHSQGVALATVAIATRLALPEADIVMLRRAALLHDIGKLSVPNSILEKPGKLTDLEWAVVKKHSFYTLEILRRIPGFLELSEVAAAHHERLDGSGYFRGWNHTQLNLHARILAVADVYDALAAHRPYRGALPLEKVYSIMNSEAPHALDAQCLEALQMAPVTVVNLPENPYAFQEQILPNPALVPVHAF
ncbi:MAG: HD-GYP domain-containing protein [Janthinobacterium lividum]